jgi:hypothetical protein
MAIKVETIDEETISVNSKIIKKDMNNNWIAQEELTPSETRQFNQHIKKTKVKDVTEPKKLW